jgi:hypothetical protein
MDLRQKLMVAGGGTIAALALLGGAVMAQSPDGGSPTPSPAQGAPASPGPGAIPGESPRPATPGQRGDGDCPDKGNSGGTQGMRGMRQGSASARF